MKILALDTATKTGWATLINWQIESGVQDFTKKRGESPGILFLRFNAWLMGIALKTLPGSTAAAPFTEILEDGYKPFDVIVYEQAHHRGGYAANLCVGLTTRLQEFAARIGAESMAVQSGTLKKATTGKGNASKEEMMVWFKEQTGRDPIDDNEADAYALLMLACKELTLNEFEAK